MNSRISTSGMYSQGLAAMLNRQAQLARTQQQMATGLRMNTTADDPVAAGVAVALDRANAQLERYGRNADVALHRLSLEETALKSVNDGLTRMHDLALQANNPTLGDDSRRAIAAEVETLRDGLIALANSSDGAGRHLFGGSQDGSPPFIETSGGVSYAGDQNQRQLEVAPGLALADGDPGSEVFLRVPTGSGGIAARAVAGNTGNAALASAGVSDISAWDNGQYTVSFLAGNYEVRDAASVVITSGVYVPEQAIGFRGVQVSMRGTPADGDAFNVGPAPSSDVFATAQRLVDALRVPITGATTRADLQNALYASIEDIAGAQGHFIDMRSGVGARLASLDSAADARSAQTLTLETTLSSLRDLDYAEASTRLAIGLTALEAAQASFLKIQSLSLFNRL